MILTIAAGGLLFEEFVDIDKGFIIAFCTAVLSVMVGLFILSHRQQMREHSRVRIANASMCHSQGHNEISSTQQMQDHPQEQAWRTPEGRTRASASDVASDSEAYMHTYGTEMQSPADFSPADFSPADAGHELPHRVASQAERLDDEGEARPEGSVSSVSPVLPDARSKTGYWHSRAAPEGMMRAASGQDIESMQPKGHRRSRTYG